MGDIRWTIARVGHPEIEKLDIVGQLGSIGGRNRPFTIPKLPAQPESSAPLKSPPVLVTT